MSSCREIECQSAKTTTTKEKKKTTSGMATRTASARSSTVTIELLGRPFFCIETTLAFLIENSHAIIPLPARQSVFDGAALKSQLFSPCTSVGALRTGSRTGVSSSVRR